MAVLDVFNDFYVVPFVGFQQDSDTFRQMKVMAPERSVNCIVLLRR